MRTGTRSVGHRVFSLNCSLIGERCLGSHLELKLTVPRLGSKKGVAGLPIVCEILLDATGARFERYCELLERHVWDSVIAGIPIFIDLSAVDRTVIEVLEEFNRR